MTQRRYASIQLDERTEELTGTSLKCRTLGHAWEPKPQGKARREELFRTGQTELVNVCLRCTTERIDRVDLDTGDVVQRTTHYPQDYLLSVHGQGRLPRRCARQAMLVRLSMA